MKRIATKNSKISSPADLTLSASAFYRLVEMGIVVDGRAGGLVVGNRLEQGGIAVICQTGNRFVLQKERITCDDFVLHYGLSDPDLTAPPYLQGDSRIRPFSHLIISDASPDDKIIWLTHEQVVVPAEQALPHLRELNAMNTDMNPFLFCDLEDVFEPRHLYV